MRCPSYRTASERGTVWNKHCEGSVFLRAVLRIHMMTCLSSALPCSFIRVFCSRRESEHDQIVRSIYEDVESQIREEREKHSTQVWMFVTFIDFAMDQK